MSDPSSVTKPTVPPVETPVAPSEPPIVAPRASEPPPPRREPPQTIVDKAFQVTQAYAEYVWADVKVLFAEIKPAFVKFGVKQRNFLIGLVIVILLLLWLF
jgi:hypothetical protein